MTDRILKADLDAIAAYLDGITHHSQGFRIHKATKGWKLVRDGGWYMSPVLPKRGLYQWLLAYIAGIEDGQKILTAKREG